MRIVAIIQARMGSTRLPGKVLLPLQDRTVLGHVINRVRAVPSISEVIVATSTQVLDDAVEAEALRERALVYRGSEQDVLSRFYEAAVTHAAELVIRITADCPLIDPSIIGATIQRLIDTGADYASNCLQRTYPRGLDVEVFTMLALQQAFQWADRPEQREHVTPFIYQSPDEFKLVHVTHVENFADYRWTLDTEEDWQLISHIYSAIHKPGYMFTWEEALRLCQANPHLLLLNQHIEQKKLGER